MSALLETTAVKKNSMRNASLCLLLVTTYVLTHRYRMVGDGELYAIQAMARINPALKSDVYLAAGSQDSFTLFSPLYALTIRCLGLWYAGVALFALCTISLLASAWAMAASLWDEGTAWLAVGLLIVAASNYGAYSVFQYAENYLTARSLAEALIVSCMAAHFRGFRRTSWVLALLAFVIHPLMALPGILTLACLSVPLAHSLLGAVAGVAFSLGLVVTASAMNQSSGMLAIMSGQWLEMVRERSQFLFLNYWHFSDWESHLRVLVTLVLAALSTHEIRERRLCAAATLVGVTGLTVALIAGSFGPVAILLQGQAWRWFWVTAFVAVLVLVPTALRLWRDGGAGAVSGGLLIAAWTFPPVNGAYVAVGALGIWLARKQVREPTQRVLKILVLLLAAAIILWTLANIWSLCSTHPVTKTGEPDLIERLRSIWALQLPALIVIALALLWLRTDHGVIQLVLAAAPLLVVCAFTIPGTFKRNGTVATPAEIEALSDWRSAIPATSNVLLLADRVSASFAWFALQRPSYLTINQSAGVVFSAASSAEIRRRSEVLLPVEDPDWKLLTQNIQKQRKEKIANESRPLTAERLLEICSDKQLGFVIAKESLGLGALTHTGPGKWKDWKLFDCGQVRRGAPSV